VRAFLIIPLFAFWTAVPALADPSGSVDETLEQARAYAAEADYDSMIALLESELEENPDHAYLQLELARAHAWKGNHEKAARLLTGLERRYPDNPDVGLVAGYLAYYQQDYETARNKFEGILDAYPGYEDARDGLENVERALRRPVPQNWSVDTGFEWSTFDRQDRPDWFNSFVQLTRRINEGRSAVHARIERYDQFENIDSYYETGISHSFGDRLYGYVRAGITPEADFRPDYRLAGGGAFRLTPPTRLAVPIWLTLDMRYDKYADTEIVNADPGLRAVFAPGWAASTKIITVNEAGKDTLYGWLGRLDGRLFDDLGFYAGYANAPETVAARTVDTVTLFGGLSLDLTPRHTLRLGYTRDDRQNSYLRHALSASVSFRF